MNAVIDGDEKLLLLRSLVDDEFRVEVDEEDEDVQREPADAKQKHDDGQHLDDLKAHGHDDRGYPK